MDDPVVTLATQAFVRMLRREFERRKPGQANPVPAWEDMRPIDRESFTRCVRAAVSVAIDEIEKSTNT